MPAGAPGATGSQILTFMNRTKNPDVPTVTANMLSRAAAWIGESRGLEEENGDPRSATPDEFIDWIWFSLREQVKAKARRDNSVVELEDTA